MEETKEKPTEEPKEAKEKQEEQELAPMISPLPCWACTSCLLQIIGWGWDGTLVIRCSTCGQIGCLSQLVGQVQPLQKIRDLKKLSYFE